MNIHCRAGNAPFSSETTTKNLFEQKNPTTLQEVKPEKFIIHSFECQQQAAHIRNRTIHAIKQDDQAMASFRYLQSKTGYEVCRQEEKAYTLLAFIEIIVGCIFSPEAALYFMIPTIPSAIIAKRNGIRYSQTADIAESYLQKSLSLRSLEEIKQLHYDKQGLEKLEQILMTEGIKVDSLRSKINQYE